MQDLQNQKRILLRPVKVLVITDDDSSFQRLNQGIHSIATGDEFIVWQANDIRSATSLYRKQHPDLVLLCSRYSLPEMTAFCEEVRQSESRRHTGILLLSEKTPGADNTAADCLTIGADDFVSSQASDAELATRIRAIIRLKSMTDELRSANHRLHLLSLTDELSGLANMRRFNQVFSEQMRQCRHGQAGVAVFMIDLDHFKDVNDNHNHLVGSFVIGEVGRLMRQSGLLDLQDVGARYGGDEYILSIVCDDIEVAMQKADAIRKILNLHIFRKEEHEVSITGSIGVAWVAKGFNGRAEDLIKAADLMLYRSKEAGRNRVSAMVLRYPIDFEHIGRTHLVDRDASSDDDSLPRLYKAE